MLNDYGTYTTHRIHRVYKPTSNRGAFVRATLAALRISDPERYFFFLWKDCPTLDKCSGGFP